MLDSSFTDSLGRWNPQLLRELRGRLKPRTVIVSIALSAIFQIFLLLITSPTSQTTPANGWLNLWKIITWMLPYTVFTLGSYFIVNDIAEEQKRGTLNFIRLSPRPAWQILIGKLLGVPILLYLAVGLTIPLHCFAGFQGAISLPLILSVYLFLAIGCVTCYSAALLCGLMGGKQGITNRQAATAIGFAAIVFLIVAPSYMAWNINVTWRSLLDISEIFGEKSPVISWFFFEINTIGLVSHCFTLLILGITTFLLWALLLRNFRKPRSTPLSKRQSYGILAFIEVLTLGFLLPISLESSDSAALAASCMYAITTISLLVLMFGICPQRQALLDWVRYDSLSWQSLIWSDKSPVLLAVVIHLVVANALLIPWLFAIGIGTKKIVETGLLVIATANIILIYSTFVQQVFATKIRNPMMWAIGGLSFWSIIAPTMLGLLQLSPARIPATVALWTLFGYPFLHFNKPELIPFVGFGIVIQWLFLAFLLSRFQKTMQNLKAS
jgi:hypothetical protein